VEVEHSVGTRRPDLTLTRGGKAVAAVEVFATHAVDGEKARVLASLRLPWVEVRAQDVLQGVAWTPAQLLPVHKEGPDQQWHCDACERALARLAREQEGRAMWAAEAQKNGEFSLFARVVDVFYPSGKRWRGVYEILEEREDGKVVALVLRAWKGDQTRFPGGRAENKERVEREFSEWMGVHRRRRGALVDWPMGWLPVGSDWVASDYYAYANLHYPRRYAWDDAKRCWVLVPEFENLRWDAQ
ncbi:MAG: hypothetical protein ABL997_21835, partial [Planctomycetota bacterium]